MLTIKNLEKIKGFAVGGEYMVAKMYEDRATYRINLNDMSGVHKRDLRLSRFLFKGGYRLTYGNFFIYLSKDEIEEIPRILSAIEKLICS